MKRLIMLILVYAFMMLSYSLQAQEAPKKSDKKGKMATGAQSADLPYSASYSSRFKVAGNDLSKMILELYKSYEGQDFSNDEKFADTVVVFLPEGKMLRGKEEVISTFKQMRAGLNTVKFEFSAIIPLTSVDRNEDWVALWGTQMMTPADNSTTNTMLEFQTIWRVNKDKKVDFIKFFESKPVQQ
jgi:hypothetical protein